MRSDKARDSREAAVLMQLNKALLQARIEHRPPVAFVLTEDDYRTLKSIASPHGMYIADAGEYYMQVPVTYHAGVEKSTLATRDY